MDINLTCCQEKHFSFTALNKSLSYVHGRKSFARCCCLFYKSPFDLYLFSLDLPNFSHTHHVERTQDSVNFAKEVPCSSSQSISLNMCSCLWIHPNCWWRLNDWASPVQCYLDICQQNRPFCNLASPMTFLIATFLFMITENLSMINQDK